MNPQAIQEKLNQQTSIIQQLSLENTQLQDKVKYLEDKIKLLINERIQEKMQNMKKVPDISKVEENITLSIDPSCTNI